MVLLPVHCLPPPPCPWPCPPLSPRAQVQLQDLWSEDRVPIAKCTPRTTCAALPATHPSRTSQDRVALDLATEACSLPVHCSLSPVKPGQTLRLQFTEPRDVLLCNRITGAASGAFKPFLVVHGSPAAGGQALLMRPISMQWTPGCISFLCKGQRPVALRGVWLEEATGGLFYAQCASEDVASPCTSAGSGQCTIC